MLVSRLERGMVGRNRSRGCLSASVVEQVMTTVAALLAECHPAIDRVVVVDITYQGRSTWSSASPILTSSPAC